MSIVLVRHGRTTANASGLLLGRLDPPLDGAGEAQAAAVAAELSALPTVPLRVVSSPLVRARRTAEVVAGALGRAVEVDDRWIELDYGMLDGVPLTDVPAETWATWRRDVEFCPEGGECLAAVGQRVRAACEELAAGAGGDVVVVSHVSPIKAAVAWALGADDLLAWRLYLAPGSISRIEIGPNGPSLSRFNLVPGGPV